MSFCYLHGVIPVSDIQRVQTVRSNGSVVWHAVYETMFTTESREEIDGSFRTFSPASDSNFPDNSLLIVHGKFALPFLPAIPQHPRSCFLIESIHHSSFTMDTSKEDCDSFLPSDNVPSLSLLGNVVGRIVEMGDGAKGVDVRVGIYIHGKSVDCLFRFVLCFSFI